MIELSIVERENKIDIYKEEIISREKHYVTGILVPEICYRSDTR
jgi:hypothetical protein